jgi:chemotaxis methyl-accepting protein methylase
MIAEAERSSGNLLRSVSFTIGDISSLPASQYDAILCRGVLNDFVDESDRESAFDAFGRALRRDGVMVLDVRECDRARPKESAAPCSGAAHAD